jgi:hypothetical protein
MRPIVQKEFFDFSAQREAYTPFMYADVLNLVTTGVGNLIDAGPNNNPGGNAPSVVRARLNNVVSAAAMDPAMRLPWKLRGPGWSRLNPVAGAPVSPSEVADAWTRVKKQNEVVPDFSQGGGLAYAGLTNLTLDLETIRALFNRTLASFDATIAKHYPGYDTWPADAQQAILSMSWANGPNFSFPVFKAAADRRDFDAMADASFFKGGGGTPDKRTGRNLENQIMFHNAAVVERTGADPDRLIFPGTSGGLVPGGAPGAVVPSAGIQVVSTRTMALAAAGLTVAFFGVRALSTSAARNRLKKVFV